ncbi:MAG: porin [Burkholderiales bacterium]
MDKKLMVLAVTSVFAAPVFGQASNVTLYGRANLGISTYQATGAAAGSAADFKSKPVVFDSGSRLGVRGVEDLGGGLRAIFQIESGVNIDTGNAQGQGGQNNNSSGFLGSRPSFVGLEGGFGRVTFGRQDVWWGNGTIMQTGANYVNTDIPFLTGSAGRVNAGIARQSNVLQYTTPTFGGANATLSYQPNSEGAAAGANVDARNYGVTARWAGGPISAQIDWSEVKAATPVAPAVQATNKNLKGSVGFTYMPGAQISVLGMQLKNLNVPGVAGLAALDDDLKQTFFAVSWEHAFGNIQALAQFGQGGKISGCTEAATTTCDNTKTRAFMLGGRYNMSKRTAVYLTYNQITNQANATMDYVGGSVTSANNGVPAVGATSSGLATPVGGVPAGSAGADPRIIALGVWHQF